MKDNANLYALLSSGFPKDRSLTAIETPDRLYSWADLEETSARMAALLCSLNLPEGARIAVQVEKSPEALMLYLATLRAGYVYIPLNTAYRAGEVEYFLTNSEPSVFVCDSANLAWMNDLANKVGLRHLYTLNADGDGTLIDSARGQQAGFGIVDRDADDLAAILYTSGTTGRSKGAMLSHRNLVTNAQALHTTWGMNRDDILLHMLPIFHVHGLFVASHGALLAGARMIWLPKLNIDEALQYLPRCTLMMGVPTYYVRLLSDGRFGRDTCSNMRLFISGSAPLLPETFKAFQDRSGHTILERYGMSETVMLTSNPYDGNQGERIAGTVGKPLPGISVRVVDAHLAPLGAAEIGDVQVRGPNVFSGYWRMPEKTKEEFTADGWFKTGDIGVWGGPGIPDDYLSIVGRSKDLIISGGYNVYPKEIELAIDAMPGVLESAVVGMPHPDFGEMVVAVVVPENGVRLDAETMLMELKQQLANFKIPKRIHFTAALARNAMGKVQKNVLRDQYKNP